MHDRLAPAVIGVEYPSGRDAVDRANTQALVPTRLGRRCVVGRQIQRGRTQGAGKRYWLGEAERFER